MREEERLRLSAFIDSHVESILKEFEEFARTHTQAGAEMSIAALRDHAAGMLSAIARDLEQPQSAVEQATKGRGDAAEAEGSEPTAAERHGHDRAVSGFTLREMFAEYRALRASVLRLWTAARGRLDGSDLQDLIRFNEAIDQALAESIRRFSASVDSSRETFLAILSHDLRSPLSAVLTAATFLEERGGIQEANDRAMLERIRLSGQRMSALVSDLLDFTQSRLGRGIPITRTEVDLEQIVRDTVEEICTGRPGKNLRVSAVGDLRGRWDGRRLRQALANLVENAVQHGNEHGPIALEVRGDASEVVVTVHNEGEAIPAGELRRIFDPFCQLDRGRNHARATHEGVGLGLYIAQQIVAAHGGRIDVRSSTERGTTFTLCLPRDP